MEEGSIKEGEGRGWLGRGKEEDVGCIGCGEGDNRERSLFFIEERRGGLRIWRKGDSVLWDVSGWGELGVEEI